MDKYTYSLKNQLTYSNIKIDFEIELYVTIITNAQKPEGAKIRAVFVPLDKILTIHDYATAHLPNIIRHPYHT